MKNTLPQTSGIYKITCLENGKIYIGSSLNMRQRCFDHSSRLNRNKHDNTHLQSAWNKYGKGAFIIEVVELVMPWSILDREQYWLDTLQSYDHKIGFNRGLIANAPQSGRPLTEDHKMKISLANMGKKAPNAGCSPTQETRRRMSVSSRGKILSAETRHKISIGGKGRKVSPETIARIIIHHEKEYIITSPDGIEQKISGLAQFCRANKLGRSKMSEVCSGKKSSHKGWKCRYA